MTRVCHMSSAHRGLDIRIFAKECASLAEAGYETHLVITASADEVAKAAARNVCLHALSPPTGRLARMLKQGWRCYRAARKLDADIYHFHDPELIPYGMLLKLAGKRVIYDVHEDLPRDILGKEWIPSWARHVVAAGAGVLEYVGARWFFAVVAATPFIASRYRRATRNVVDINNYPMPDELAPQEAVIGRCRQVCYVGGITRARGIEPLIRALALMPDVRLALCGRFEDRSFKEAMQALPGWSQVDYHGHLDRDGVRAVMTQSLAGMVTLFPTPAYVDALPVKMFEYMSAALPVVASHFSLWRQIIDEAGAGVCVDPTSPEAIAGAVRALANKPAAIEQMGLAGRKAILEKYNWPKEAQKLLNFYRSLL